MTLTSKQEAFTLGVFRGLSASEAYRQAYEAERMSPAVIHVKASELLRNGKVAVRLAELRAPVLKRASVSSEDIARRAWEIASQDAPDRVSALGLLARLHPEFNVKHEHSGPDGGPIPVAVLQAFASLTPEQVARLAESR